MVQKFDKILVVGIGNLLCRDEGVGIHVIEEMKAMRLPSHIHLLEIGTSTLDLIHYLEGVKKLIVLDAMKAGGSPGTVYQCSPEALLPKGEKPVSLHDIGVIETLAIAKKMGREIETIVIGMEPRLIEWGMELSEEVREKIPTMVEVILKECEKDLSHAR